VRGTPIWTRYVDDYLKSRNLVLRADLLPLPGANIPLPRNLSANGHRAFNDYLAGTPHKAFAISPCGTFGWRGAQRTIDEAKAGALEFCKKRADDCRVIAVDDMAIE
jgi:hypothetical protein